MKRHPRLALVAFPLLLGACAGWPFGDRAPAGPAPDPAYGVEEVDSEAIVDFYERAAFFYGRLANRRVNTLSTYRDEVLRDFFRTETAFADYYADLAQSLVDAHVERSRPLSLEVVEFKLEGPGEARVLTRIVGENGLPLRPGQTGLDREDRWERVQGSWWIIPGKL